jgi:hypothetical protein
VEKKKTTVARWNDGLKRQCHEIFYHRVFNQTIPPRALIHKLKMFRIWLRIRQDFLDNYLQSSDSAVSMRENGALYKDFLQEQDSPERNLLQRGSNYRWNT